MKHFTASLAGAARATRFSAALATVASLMFSTFAMAQTSAPAAVGAPPVAKKVPQTFENFGDKRVDDYGWLRGKEKPEVIEYLKAENAYTDAVMAPHKAFGEQLYKEMLGRIKETDEQVPFLQRGYWYNSKTEQGKQYAIYVRRKGSLSAAEQVVLDGNELGKDQKYMAVGTMAVSPDNNILAYSVDFTGYRQYSLRFKNLSTGETYPETLERVTSLAWALDSKTLFYTTEDAVTKRSNKLFRHRLGEKQDELLYEEKDELYNLGVDSTRSMGYIIATSESSETTEQRILDASKPAGTFTVYKPRKDNIKYYVDHQGSSFLVVTNDKGRNFRLVKTGTALTADEKTWKELIAHRADVKLDAVEVFKNFFVAVEKSGGLPQLRIFDAKTNSVRAISFPEAAYTASPGQNAEYDAKLFRFNYGSLVTPESVYDYDVAKHTRELKKQQPVLGGYKPDEYAVERVMATARDGTKVPVSMVYKKSMRKAGVAQPMLLYGYGSYGISMPLGFRSTRLSLLDRGMIFAIAHIRGGGEMGKAWHDNGKMAKKMNTFTDFVDCADFLIARQYTSPSQLTIQGGSAGGLLMGAVSNLRPELFKAVVSQVPFVDVMNTMLDASLPLTTGEYLEWGNPNEEAAYKTMRAYSPYENLSAKAYPNMLVETSLNDSQVPYWEAAKYVARLRAVKTDTNTVLLKTNLDAGHGGASGRYDYLKEIAFTYSYVLAQLGLAK